MSHTFTNLTKTALIASLIVVATYAMAQDGTIYPLQTPAEPNAILLGTGGVEGQPAPETWFRQWGDPMARNISTATLTPFLPKPGKANGAAVIVAQAVASDGCQWATKVGKLRRLWQTKASLPSYSNTGSFLHLSHLTPLKSR